MKISILMLVFLLFSYFEFHMKYQNQEDYIRVMQLNKDLKAGQVLLESDYDVVEVKKEYFNTRQTTFKVKDMYLKQDLPSGTILLREMLVSENQQKLRSFEALITIKCDTVESNGWIAKPTDKVDIVMVLQNESILIENAIVLKRFSENFDESDKFSYYTLKVDKKQAYQYFENQKNARIYISIKQES